MKIGILGTGFMGKMHTQIFKSFSDVDVVGICGRDHEKTKLVANEFGVKSYTDPFSLLMEKDIDAIDVCYATNAHCEFVIEALKAGKHVFCETPLTYKFEEAEMMLDCARKSGKMLMVALYDRFQSQYKYVYDFVKSGQIGKPKVVFINRRSQPYYASDDILLNLMIHDFDYVNWLLGTPKSIICKGLSLHEGICDHVSAILDYEDTLVMLEGSTLMPNSFPFSTSLRIVCEEGAIDLNWKWGDSGPISDVILYWNNGKQEQLNIPDYDPYYSECRYFIECIKGVADPNTLGIESAYNSIKLAVKAKESLKQDMLRVII